MSSSSIASACAMPSGEAVDRAEARTNIEGATAAELAQARANTRLIKARCTQCHTAGKAEIRRWSAAMQTARAQCLEPSLALSAAERVRCLRSDPADPTSAFTEEKLGFLVLATTHTAFRTLFAEAAGTGPSAFNEFTTDASMPPLGASQTRFTEREFADLDAWVRAGLPALDEALIEPSQPCVPFVSPKLSEHLGRMKAEGWAARHRESALPMLACGPSDAPSTCLTTMPDRTTQWGATGVAQTIRLLHDLPFSTYAWMRSSADGRFVGFGGEPARILDLGAAGGPRPIRVNAEFDAAFLPDNSGFSYAAPSGSRVHVCRQSVLLNATTQASPSISLTEPGCAAISSADYQAIGASLDGTMFFMASGTHENDITFSLTHGPLSGSFGENAFTNVIPMINSGISYVERPKTQLLHPHEGDGGLSPSNELLYTRFGRSAGKRGFRIRKLMPRFEGSAVTIQTEELATICASGGKVMGSFDERFLVTHQYVDPEENTGMPNNSSNIILFDLLTNETIRLTQMSRGVYAFSPTFRADGWIYFMVKDANTRKEAMVASDAAVRRLAQH